MTWRRVLQGLCLAALACGPAMMGPRRPGDIPASRVFFWKVSSSELTYGSECSDSMNLRGQFRPIAFGASTYLSYRLTADGQTAESLTCASLDWRSCRVTDGGIVFSVQGVDLVGSRQASTGITNSECRLQTPEQWTLSDTGPTMTITIGSALALAQADGGTVACVGLEQGVRAESPNGKGLEGCVLSYVMNADFTAPQQ